MWPLGEITNAPQVLIKIRILTEILQITHMEKKQLAKEVERLSGQLLKKEHSRRDDIKTKQVEINRLTAEIDDLKKQLQIKNTQVQQSLILFTRCANTSKCLDYSMIS